MPALENGGYFQKPTLVFSGTLGAKFFFFFSKIGGVALVLVFFELFHENGLILPHELSQVAGEPVEAVPAAEAGAEPTAPARVANRRVLHTAGLARERVVNIAAWVHDPMTGQAPVVPIYHRRGVEDEALRDGDTPAIWEYFGFYVLDPVRLQIFSRGRPGRPVRPIRSIHPVLCWI